MIIAGTLGIRAARFLQGGRQRGQMTWCAAKGAHDGVHFLTACLGVPAPALPLVRPPTIRPGKILTG